MKLFYKSIVTASALLLTTASLSTMAAEKKAQWLFVVNAKQGEMMKKDGHYVFTLKGVNPNTLAFTDRPQRQAHNIRTDTFFQHWDKAFKSSSPNTGFVHAQVKTGKITPDAFEISSPKRIAENTWQFKVNVLHGDKVKMGKFQQVNLFIDPTHNIPMKYWEEG